MGSIRLRAALRPIVQAVCERRSYPAPSLGEPAADFAPWFVLRDAAGGDLVVVSAHSTNVNFLLGSEGFLHSIDLPLAASELEGQVSDILDAVLSGGLVVLDEDNAELRTAGGTITLSLFPG